MAATTTTTTAATAAVLSRATASRFGNAVGASTGRLHRGWWRHGLAGLQVDVDAVAIAATEGGPNLVAIARLDHTASLRLFNESGRTVASGKMRFPRPISSTITRGSATSALPLPTLPPIVRGN